MKELPTADYVVVQLNVHTVRDALRAVWEAGFNAADRTTRGDCGCDCHNPEPPKNPYGEDM